MKKKYFYNKIKIISVLAVALFMMLVAGTTFAADKYPAPRGAVNDFANIIDPESAAKMEALASEVLQKTGTAVVVVTVPTIGDNEDYNFYVNGLYKAWGIGKKGEDKGVLIFLTLKERKIRIETGYGVEGILPDGLVGEIRDKYLKPQLQAGNYGKAFYDTMYVLSSYIAKDAHVQLSDSPQPMPYMHNARQVKRGGNVVGLIFFFIVAALLLGTRTGRSMLPWILLMFLGGGGRGGGGDGGFSGGFGGFGGGMSGGGGAGGDF
ncbi:MAG TPA: TPM domain-containing protein [Smithella sp.]|nr:TPM domain-containing protein [Smithella sp.]